ncbi:MAG: ROK family protein [Syntrophothermus sp.]
MSYATDKRIVLTLDAGGTNLRFSAVQAEKEMFEPVIFSSRSDSLESLLGMITAGFKMVESKLPAKPVAISFSFPGPADYTSGVIGDLQNLPLFRNGVALGPMLEEIFGIPVYINNDGDLFTYGEAISGLLPKINHKLEEAGNPKRYKNLLGVTFGTGFGGGIVTGASLFPGDNSAAGEINRMRNKLYSNFDVEDSVSIRGVKREYARFAKIDFADAPEPEDIFKIGTGEKEGNREAALKSFETFAIAAGNTIADAVTLVDGLVVIGGGLSGAHSLFLSRLVQEMNAPFETVAGEPLPRMEISAFNLEDPEDLGRFVKKTAREIPVPFSSKKVLYDPEKKTGVGVSVLGTSNAVNIGAYAFALHQLDLNK